jgi:hypothetical protein
MPIHLLLNCFCLRLRKSLLLNSAKGIAGILVMFGCFLKIQDISRLGEQLNQASKNSTRHQEIFWMRNLKPAPTRTAFLMRKIGILGIAHKSSLAPTVKGIAARVQQLLLRSKVVRASRVSVEIVPIPDPENFLLALDSAYRVPRFAATFHGPNPFDADELFQKPLSVYLKSAHGKKGRAQIEGEDLNREVLQSVTRSTAATGNDASATIQKSKSQKPVRIHLQGDAVKRRYTEEEHTPQAVLEDLEKLYVRVRSNENN